MQELCFDFRFPASPLGVRYAMRTMMRQLRPSVVDTDRLSAIEIAVTEATNNVVEHGYVADDGAHVHLNVTVTRTRVAIEIIDCGAPYPGGTVPPLRQHDLTGDRMDLPEGGFGWMMIRELTRCLHYERQGDKNHLHLYF